MINFIAAALISAFVVTEILDFWDELIDGLTKIVNSVKRLMSGIFQGAKAFVQKVGGAIREIVKSYSYSEREDQWYETERERKVDSSEVPADIRSRVSGGNRVDVTNELELRMA
ncbi:MAG: hypothetical protein HDT21_05895 [Ruminococcus sp.]|nr:hypothetical protein [Ruminococcus sp.]